MFVLHWLLLVAGFYSAVNSTSDCRSRGHKVESQLTQITSLEIDHEKFLDRFFFFLKKNTSFKMAMFGMAGGHLASGIVRGFPFG